MVPGSKAVSRTDQCPPDRPDHAQPHMGICPWPPSTDNHKGPAKLTLLRACAWMVVPHFPPLPELDANTPMVHAYAPRSARYPQKGCCARFLGSFGDPTYG